MDLIKLDMQVIGFQDTDPSSVLSVKANRSMQADHIY